MAGQVLLCLLTQPRLRQAPLTSLGKPGCALKRDAERGHPKHTQTLFSSEHAQCTKTKHPDAELNKGAELEIYQLPELNLVSVLPELSFVLERSSP